MESIHRRDISKKHMTPKYFAITFEMGHHDREIWQALLSEWPFESFHHEGNQIKGYIQDHDITETLMEFISEHLGIHYDDYELEQVPDKNWNAVWESSFNPVEVDDFCFIRAEFHSLNEGKFRHVITISPKMAFGTGHHATTYMMLQAMAKLDFNGKKVLDFGCGTGILSIVAAKEGAINVIGVDIQIEAIENSIEHSEMNNVRAVCEFYLGGLEKANNEKYDVILANINRNIILENLTEMVTLLNPGGYLLLSGIMFDDVEIISTTLRQANMNIISTAEKDQWVQMTTSID
ncbi:MAG TPA: 50S ribosomal protein L11 methyltransferase [Saprospiraceae bacterium]|nr:50S ribosomal protein L11 methyltransferase [Saprospiraceae bacterium]